MAKMKNLYGTLVPEEAIPALEKICLQYIRFCEKPFNHPDKWREDFWKLCGHPMVGAISFDNSGALVLGINEIILTDPDTGYRHRLGEYTATLRRYPEMIRGIVFECMTPLAGDGVILHHPHITQRGVCMSADGRERINNYLMHGDIPEVFEWILVTLNTLDEYPMPGGEISRWPRA